MTLEENILTPEAAPSDEITAEDLRAAAETPCQNVCEPEKPAKAPRRKPHILLRIPLQLLSFVVAVALFVAVLAGALILDLQQLTSAGSLNTLIDAVIDTVISTSAPAQPRAAVPRDARQAPFSIHYDETQGNAADEYYVYIDEDGNTVVMDSEGNIVNGGSYVVDENGNITFSDIADIVVDENGNVIIGDITVDEIPEDILSGGSSEESIEGLIDWIYDQVAEANGGELEVSKEQVQTVIAESTVSEFLSEKLAGYAEDFINGTSNTSITAEDIMGLLEENEELLKNELQLELTPEIKQELQLSMEQMLEESDINNVIREEVFATVEDTINQSTESMGVDMDQIRQILQMLVSAEIRNAVLGVVGGLILLLLLLNFYNIPAGMTWAAFPCLLAAGILQLPMTLVRNIAAADPTLAATPILQLLNSFAGVLRPIHLGVLILGIALLVISIVWRIIRSNRRK